MWKDKNILLASRSPRRSYLLEQAGIAFTTHPVDVEETYPKDLPKKEVAEYLAIKKARAARSLIRKKNDIVLAADSIVLLEDRIYGKPGSYEEAVETLRALSDNTHLVITGVCLLSRQREEAFSAHTKVSMEALRPDEITYYLDKYRPFDKAGAYAIQEWIGLCKISRIEGTYANVMGLPVDKVYAHLSAWDH